MVLFYYRAQFRRIVLLFMLRTRLMRKRIEYNPTYTYKHVIADLSIINQNFVK